MGGEKGVTEAAKELAFRSVGENHDKKLSLCGWRAMCWGQKKGVCSDSEKRFCCEARAGISAYSWSIEQELNLKDDILRFQL